MGAVNTVMDWCILLIFSIGVAGTSGSPCADGTGVCRESGDCSGEALTGQQAVAAGCKPPHVCCRVPDESKPIDKGVMNQEDMIQPDSRMFWSSTGYCTSSYQCVFWQYCQPLRWGYGGTCYNKKPGGSQCYYSYQCISGRCWYRQCTYYWG